ncbi:FAD-binding oxidoreductase [Desulfotomaculum nigrificans]|uniref:FAD-binding oxidoreductase n=1 Tax=Desulfotomaculum nigrificans TaxID=1565 RepID=UPI0001FAEC7F|nr:FAD-linked oxidase C-terminal domain-containing protein [Desulfotomaculum nigrificans]
MDKRVLAYLEQYVGKNNLLTTLEKRFSYTYDASPLKLAVADLPGVVVFPENTEQVSKVLRLANEKKIPVIVRGAGTNVSGGALSIEDCIVLCLNRMNRIIELDQKNSLAIVEPGVINGELQREAAKLGLFYPPDPQSSEFSTIGGNVAENAGGPRCVKYGVTRDYILGLEVVLPNGDIINTGAKTIKNVTGYDLTRLFVGSEGTLGVITKIILKLIPKPEATKLALAVFPTMEAAADTVARISASGIVPAMMEFLDNIYIRNIEEYAHVGFPKDAGAVLILAVDGDEEILDKSLQRIAEICRAAGAMQIQVAHTTKENNELMRARQAAFASMSRLNPTIIGEDFTVPRSNIPKMVAKIQEIAQKHGVIIATVGHAGDGNLHATFSCDERNEDEMKRVEAAIDDLVDATLALDGVISGEHGIGRFKAKYMEKQFDPAQLALMKSIKNLFDPNNILNPGVMFKE